MLAEIILVIIITLTGELIFALPLALAMGFNPIFALFLILIINIIPAYPIFKLFEKIYKKENRVVKFFIKRGEYLKSKAKRELDFAIIIFTPIVGVYATSLFLALIKFPTRKGIVLQTLSLLVYGLIIILGYYFLNILF
jgi:hypothetical protein